MVYIPRHDSPDVCVLHSYWYSAATREGPWTRCSRCLFYWGFEFHCKTSQGKEFFFWHLRALLFHNIQRSWNHMFMVDQVGTVGAVEPHDSSSWLLLYKAWSPMSPDLFKMSWSISTHPKGSVRHGGRSRRLQIHRVRHAVWHIHGFYEWTLAIYEDTPQIPTE